MRRLLWLAGTALIVGLVSNLSLLRPAGNPVRAQEIDPLGPNSACYVCHMTFVREPIAKVHLAAKITCVKCHGLSEKHANDENIGATKPDRVYKHGQIDGACGECHKEHDVDARKVIARFRERKLPASTAPVCTDCHGSHRIDRAAEKKQ